MNYILPFVLVLGSNKSI